MCQGQVARLAGAGSVGVLHRFRHAEVLAQDWSHEVRTVRTQVALGPAGGKHRPAAKTAGITLSPA